ncbi:MAG TPA: DUF6130 family protein [Oligoflexus sp.]|uniref:DUF6130 family protein n=1 Tax=Oligoflexus sp. TaxID=1971216 RepID=UPI002D595B68|nr:DUF6130 family protein [Oligoflexus sp.]HYX38818.1 DUF6130 family protein [Oligoflexus sp.]
MKQTHVTRHGKYLAATAFAAGILVTPGAFSGERQTAEASPYIVIENEPPARLIVDQPLPEGLELGLVWIQYRVENVRVLPVFGEAATKVSPRIGHVHVHVDDQPFWWVEASSNNTIDIAGLPVGPHKVKVVLVNANHEPIPGQSKTISFVLSKQLKQ